MKPIVNYTIAATKERHSADQNVIRRLRFTLAMMAAGAAALSLVGCSDESFMSQAPQYPESGMVMAFGAKINQESQSRADESGFADGDRMGIFVVDYEEGAPGQLLVMGNRANNTRLTFNAESNTWQSNAEIYWRDDQTPVDVYGYYPYDNGLGDVDTYSFEVSSTQDVAGTDGDMGHYEASDFLWAKASHAMPGERINLSYSHRMAGVRVILQEGDGFASGEWNKLKKQVSVDNTCRMAHIDLSTGYVTATGDFDRHVTMAETDAGYRAVVVPQSVDNGKSIIGITIDGIASNFVREGGMTYTSGKLHTFTIKVDKTSMSGDYELTLVDESISTWIADDLSHDFEANSYIVVHVEKAGTLKTVITEMGIDKATLKNLKITGQLTDEDFYFMRDEMPVLSAVNLSEVQTVDCDGEWKSTRYEKLDNVIPKKAFQQKESLRRIVLPSKITSILEFAFDGVRFTSSVIIPDCVTNIGPQAFRDVKGEYSLHLPLGLQKVGTSAFANCQMEIDCNFTEGLLEIGMNAFYDSNMTGVFHLPSTVISLGYQAFSYCGNFDTGEIVIPESITEIPESCFSNMVFRNGVRLAFHEGVRKINKNAFLGLKFNETVNFPSRLGHIGDFAFSDCEFVGDLKLPDNLAYLGIGAFKSTNIEGHIDFPDNIDAISGNWNGYNFNDSGPFSATNISSVTIGNNIEQIGALAFFECKDLKEVEIGANVTYIDKYAFGYCENLKTVRCLSSEPPVMSSYHPFGGCSANTLILVPEHAVDAYRRASGWSSFNNISAYRELNINLTEIKCLNAGCVRKALLRSEGSWSVVSIPDWITLDKTSGDKDSDISITVKPLAQGSGNREGTVELQLDGTEYTTYFTVIQYDYQYAEDEPVVLQTATSPGVPINVFIVGDGFDAEQIASGKYIAEMKSQMEYLLSIEPYKTYRDYFTVRTSIACSSDSKSLYGVSRLGTDGLDVNEGVLKEYVESVSGQKSENTLVVLLSNYASFSGKDGILSNGMRYAVVGRTSGTYPYDQRGLIQRYAGGQAFAGLASEGVTHYEFISSCKCPYCNAMGEFVGQKWAGRFENLTMSAKMSEAPWAPFIFHEKYSSIVDMYEGGYNHARGVWRSETSSVMSTYISYYNTISRYAIYKEIMRRAGLSASLDDFIANDKIELP